MSDGIVSETKIGYYTVQLLEGPTDNPVRVISPFGNSYTFLIETPGWKIATLIVSGDYSPLFKEINIEHLVQLAHVFSEELGSENHLAINL